MLADLGGLKLGAFLAAVAKPLVVCCGAEPGCRERGVDGALKPWRFPVCLVGDAIGGRVRGSFEMVLAPVSKLN